jgi:hypothetical protein
MCFHGLERDEETTAAAAAAAVIRCSYDCVLQCCCYVRCWAGRCGARTGLCWLVGCLHHSQVIPAAHRAACWPYAGTGGAYNVCPHGKAMLQGQRNVAPAAAGERVESGVSNQASVVFIGSMKQVCVAFCLFALRVHAFLHRHAPPVPHVWSPFQALLGGRVSCHVSIGHCASCPATQVPSGTAHVALPTGGCCGEQLAALPAAAAATAIMAVQPC